MRWHELFNESEPATLRSGELTAFGFKRDNPGGEWLEHNIERAASRKHHISGAITASFTKPLLITAKWLHHIPGYNDENRKPGDGQFDRLMKRVEENGFDLSPDNAGLMCVNHEGEAFIMEGNTRAAVAVALKIEMIPFAVRYWNGGESIRGHFDPSSVCLMSDLNTNPARTTHD